MDHHEANLPERRFGWWDMFVDPDNDPRADGGFENNERAMLVGYLADRRLTLPLKCEGLDTAGMAMRSVPPSDLSLLGLVRHLAGVERHWFRGVMAGEEITRPYMNDEGRDVDFEDARPDPVIVDEAWELWRGEVAYAEDLVAATDLSEVGKGEPVPLREVLIHMIEEYARHMGHADLLRERIDGRVGQ